MRARNPVSRALTRAPSAASGAPGGGFRTPAYFFSVSAPAFASSSAASILITSTPRYEPQ